MQNNQNKTVLRLTESGILLAIGILIDTFLKFDATWAYGGSITLCSMLPLVIIAYKYGVGWGSLAGVAHGVITMMISGGRAGGLAAMIEENGGIKLFLLIMLFDYILAFAAIGLAGLAPRFCKTAPGAVVAGSLIGLFGRYICHTISGFLFFGEWAEWFFTDQVPWGSWFVETFHGKALSLVYSIVYNGLYMIPEMVLTAVVGGILAKALAKQLAVNRTNIPVKKEA
ncbi:MAG: energy-coupled thiamine transporter ThiT [Candidatus Merdivicinus sp.]|jgi:thiamine transporter